MYCWALWICHLSSLSVSLFFFSLCRQTMAQWCTGSHKPNHGEVRDSILALARDMIQDLWGSFCWNIIRVLRLLASATLKWVTFCDLISSPELCSESLPTSSHLQFRRCRRRQREGAGLNDWASASQDADCLFVYMFGLLILSSGL